MQIKIKFVMVQLSFSVIPLKLRKNKIFSVSAGLLKGCTCMCKAEVGYGGILPESTGNVLILS
jgi:hypothetical protein